MQELILEDQDQKKERKKECSLRKKRARATLYWEKIGHGPRQMRRAETRDEEEKGCTDGQKQKKKRGQERKKKEIRRQFTCTCLLSTDILQGVDRVDAVANLVI